MILDSILSYMVLAVCILGLTYVVVATVQIILLAIQYKRNKRQISQCKKQIEEQWRKYNNIKKIKRREKE